MTVQEWAKEFKTFINELQMPRDDYKGIIAYIEDGVKLLKAQELPDVKPEKLEERTTKWLDQMTAEERLEEIAAILDDWDGYRTAKGLGGLINEVWAYASYPVKAQEPRVMALEEVKKADDPVFFETQSGVIYDWAIRCTENEKHVLLTIINSTIQAFRIDRYGISWRCWTSRPSDLERKNTPWEN